MDEKVAFITEWMQEQCSFAMLCRSFNISRTVGYRYVSRYLAGDFASLESFSRAPRRVWNKTPKPIEQAIVDLGESKPRYGALKILKLLEAQYDPDELPAVSTTDLILKRNGLVHKRKRVRRIVPFHPVFHASKPNQIWGADFKGEF
jgi:putative transposase